jgi:hypothetical protein
LVVDEAQNLSNRVLEEIRLLSGVETTKDKTLRIILAGQPELLAKLNSPELVQLSQRIRLRFHLTPLSKPDVYAYVDHRLQVAGADGRAIFSDDAKMLVARYTGGIPRLINTLCDTAMMGAFAIEKDHVDAADVQNAVDELQWVEYGTPTNRLPIVQVGLPVLRHVSPETVLGRVWVTTEGRTICEKELKPGRTIIGRTPENDLQIDSKYVSRHHCQLTVTGEGTLLEDLNSTNGIYMQGRRVRRHLLADGDVVQIGRHELHYTDERQVRTRPGETTIVPVDSAATGPQEAIKAPRAPPPT